MSAAEIFAQAALDIFTHLGVPVTYTPAAGTPATIQALISSSMQSQPSGMGSETWAQRTMVEMMLPELPAGGPDPGDTITDGTAVYTLEAPMENDGMLVKWVVT
jgi:hypothetical protein